MKQSACFAALVLVAACQSSTGLPPQASESLRGCWIEGRDKEATTFRWFADRDDPSVFAGEQLDYTPLKAIHTRHAAWRIDQKFGKSRLCLGGRFEAQRLCWRLSFSKEAQPSHGARALIQANADTLVIVLSDGDFERVLFNGVRDGCD